MDKKDRNRVKKVLKDYQIFIKEIKNKQNFEEEPDLLERWVKIEAELFNLFCPK
jgi:hypothetical protein